MKDTAQNFLDELDRLYEKGNPAEVESFLTKTVRMYCCDANTHYENAVTALNELGAFYRGAGKLDSSINAFHQAKQLIETHRGKNTLEYATVANNIAGAYRLKRQFKEALVLFNEALTAYEKTIGKDSYLYSSALNNISLVYSNMDDIDHAEKYVSQAICILKDKDEYREAYAISLTNLGMLRFAVKDFTMAEQLYRKAYSIYEQAGDYNPIHFSGLENSMGILKAVKRDFEGAVQNFKSARELIFSINGKSIEYTDACLSIARIYIAEHKDDAAKTELLEAKSALEMLRLTDTQKYKIIVVEIESLE